MKRPIDDIALTVVDFQKGILESSAIKWDNPSGPGSVLEAASSAVASCRKASVPVIHVGVRRPSLRGRLDELRTAVSEATGKAPRDICGLESRPDIDFCIDPKAGEDLLYKVGVSAFSGTSLDGLLRNLGVRRVLVCGVFTHMAVESTVRAGFDLGYHMYVVEDACGSASTVTHRASLGSMAAFGRAIESSALSGGQPGFFGQMREHDE